jgi:hypothetical protein
MAWIAVAIGGSALIGAGAGLYGTNQAAGAQRDAANNALTFEQQTAARNQENIQPYLNFGKDALGKLGETYSNPGSVTSNPDYRFGVTQGMDTLQNSAAARGGLLGGNFLRSADQFGQDYGTNYLTNYRNGLRSNVQIGAGAATGGGALANQSAGQIGQSYGNIGAADASGIVGGTNALTGSLSNGVNNYLLYNALSKSSYGNGGGGGPSLGVAGLGEYA